MTMYDHILVTDCGAHYSGTVVLTGLDGIPHSLRQVEYSDAPTICRWALGWAELLGLRVIMDEKILSILMKEKEVSDNAILGRG